MNSFANRCMLITLFVSILLVLLPAGAVAQGNVVEVTVCDSADIPGCEDKMRNRAPFRLIFSQDVLTVDCDIVDETCSNESSAVSWEVTNKKEDHEADIKFTGRNSSHRRFFTEQRIRKGNKKSVPERPRNLKFDSNDEARWKYEVIVHDANGKIYARKDPEILIKGSRG